MESLLKNTRKELDEIAKSFGLKPSSYANKTEIAKAIFEAQNTPAEPEPKSKLPYYKAKHINKRPIN